MKFNIQRFIGALAILLSVFFITRTVQKKQQQEDVEQAIESISTYQEEHQQDIEQGMEDIYEGIEEDLKALDSSLKAASESLSEIEIPKPKRVTGGGGGSQ